MLKSAPARCTEPRPQGSGFFRNLVLLLGIALTLSAAESPTAGSLWSPGARLADAARDQRASAVDDLVTIVVAERASAVSRGTLKTARSSGAKASITSLAGPLKSKGALPNLAGLSSESELKGEGATTRESFLTTTVAARVTEVLPNGNLVIEAIKQIQVNSEKQMIVVRGMVRPIDLTADNLVRSDRIANLQVQLNGKGVVGDAVRRPFFLYRLLLGLLPF